MVWGAPRGVDDLVAKLKENKTASTMCILGTRKFGPTEALTFSTALADNTSLSELLASGHALGVAEAAAFGEALSRNTTLRSLCLGDSDFGDKGVLALVEGLQLNHGLLVLDLEYKSIAAGEGLSKLLKRHRTLVDLRLGRNQLSESGIKALSIGLSQSSTLLRLDLSGNDLNAAAAESLGCALSPTPVLAPSESSSSAEANGDGEVQQAAGCAPPLEFLDVSKNPLGDEGAAVLLCALAKAGRGASPTLRSIRMAETGLGPGAAAALAGVLAPVDASSSSSPAGPAVADFQIVGDGGQQGALLDGVEEKHRNVSTVVCESGSGSPTPLSIIAAPRGLPLLETLDLSKNELGVSGAKDLAGAFSRGGAPRLETLSMGYTGVGNEGAAALGRAAGGVLRVLDLSGNALSGAGIGAVLSIPSLREAKLFHNSCGDEGVPLVLEALLAGGLLETLDLGANGLTGAGFETLLPGLKTCSTLQTLEVGANSNDDKAEAAVRLSQVNNPGLDVAFRRGGEAMEGAGAPPPGVGGLAGFEQAEGPPA